MRVTKMLLMAIMLITITATLSGECRLLLMIARNKETCSSHSYIHAFQRLRSQASENDDGWGIAYYLSDSVTTGEGTVYLYPNGEELSDRYASWRDASDCGDFHNAYHTNLRPGPTRLIAAHVRNATSGSNDDPVPNPHPFVFSTWAGSYVFAHNGTADNFSKSNMSTFIDTLITESGWSEPKWGPWRDHDVDSGVYFGFIMAHIKLNNWDVLRGLREALTHAYVNNTNWTARNFVFSDGYDAYAYRSYLVNPNSYTLEYAILNDSLPQVDNTTAYIMSELPNYNYYNDNKIQVDNDELVYIPSRGRPVHFKNFNSLNNFRLVKNPAPPTSHNQGPYWTWDSFPVVNTVSDSAVHIMTQDVNNGGSGIGFNYALEVFNYQYNINRDEIVDDWSEDTNNPLRNIYPQDGYKIKHVLDHPSSYAPQIRGLIAPADMVFELRPYSDNWVGYWLLNSQTFKDALGDVFDDVYSISARDWQYTAGFPYPASGYAMEFGQMFNIKLKRGIENPIQFTWNNSRQPGEWGTPLRSSPEFFTYTHGPEYQVIDIEYIENGDNIEEVGVFAGGVCIGAATTDYYPVQILVYPDGYEGLELEFQYYEGNRSFSVANHSAEIYDRDTGRYTLGQLRAGDQDHTLVRLSLKPELTKTDSIPIELSLYPNPSNPDVSISFHLPEMRDLEITLYNIRGQQVKQLAKGEYEAGNYRFNWNGTNDNGQPVSSGIYFCRVKAGSETVTGKLMLLK